MNQELLKQSFFQLFNVPQQYTVDKNSLQSRLRELQREFHPDNFAADSSLAAQALIFSSRINEGFNVLNDPLKRALYFLELAGNPVDLVHDTKFAPEFLLAQIELREQISAAQATEDFEQLEQIEENLRVERSRLEHGLRESLSDSKQYTVAVEQIKQLAFYQKLEHLVSEVLSNL